jgi:hypothetical protein
MTTGGGRPRSMAASMLVGGTRQVGAPWWARPKKAAKQSKNWREHYFLQRALARCEPVGHHAKKVVFAPKVPKEFWTVDTTSIFF